MHRRNLLQAISEYAARHPEESAVTERFTRFVESEVRCFERDCWRGHVTGSAWLMDPDERALLLTHHKKLDIWVQLGGHSDGDPDTLAVACKEAEEESGVSVDVITPQVFDLDIHEIPARKDDPAHFHFDVRFALRARSRDVVVSGESNDLAWVALPEIAALTQETSILRMRDKWLARQDSTQSR